MRRVCGLGDLVLTLPFLRSLRTLHPAAEIHMIGHPEHLELLEATGCIAAGFSEAGSGWHHLYTGRKIPWRALRPDPRAYDLVCIFVPDPALSPLVTSLREVLGERVVAVPARPPMGGQVHAALHPLRHLPLPSPEGLLRVGPPLILRQAQEQAQVNSIRNRRKAGLLPVIIHPGSGSPRKNWPADLFLELLRRLKEGLTSASPWLLEGPADEEAVQAILHSLGGETEIPVLRPHRLTELAALLQEASLLVGNDSGVTHLSATLGVPTIAIFGPSDPSVWAPIGPRVRVLYHHAPCEPCHLERDRQCLHLVCPRFPSLEEAWEAVRASLRGS